MESNEAVWFSSPGDHGNVAPAPTPTLGPGQLLIKNHAVALNPVDYMMRDDGLFLDTWPITFGCDLAGEIVEVGPTTTTATTTTNTTSAFKVGQRVLAHALVLQYKDYTQAAFQKYTVVSAAGTAPLPANISYEAGCSIPLALDTAATGLYTADHLHLPLPSTSPKPLNKTILIWGGSGSVGSMAVQLAAASGLTVISTASPRNFDFVKSLGASQVFDYNNNTSQVSADILSQLQGTDFVGAFDATGSAESAQPVADIVSALGGGKVASALKTAQAPGVVAKMVYAPQAILPPNEAVAKGVWVDFLPKALESGQFRPAPPVKVVGHGLAAVPDAVDEMKKGVSATKLVVML